MQYIGQVAPFALNFAPRGWLPCEGQILKVADHGELFSVIGAQFGGDGRQTFALPDLRGRVVVAAGRSDQLPTVELGEMGFMSTRGEVGEPSVPYLALQYCIATEGTLPTRP